MPLLDSFPHCQCNAAPTGGYATTYLNSACSVTSIPSTLNLTNAIEEVNYDPLTCVCDSLQVTKWGCFVYNMFVYLAITDTLYIYCNEMGVKSIYFYHGVDQLEQARATLWFVSFIYVPSSCRIVLRNPLLLCPLYKIIGYCETCIYAIVLQ